MPSMQSIQSVGNMGTLPYRRNDVPVVYDGTVLATMGISPSGWLGMSYAERVNRILMRHWSSGRSSWTASDEARLQRMIGSADALATKDGASLLAGMNTTCSEWLSLDYVERTRRLLLAYWGNGNGPAENLQSARWTAAYQARLQRIIDSIERYCASSAAPNPSGQVLLPLITARPFVQSGYYAPIQSYPFSASYWLSKSGVQCGVWVSLSYASKYSYMNNALMYSGVSLSPNAINALVSDIDTYCNGIAQTSSFLYPYNYPSPPYYGFGYPLPYAFPYIYSLSQYRLGPVYGYGSWGGFGGFGGGFGGRAEGGGHGGGGKGGK